MSIKDKLGVKLVIGDDVVYYCPEEEELKVGEVTEINTLDLPYLIVNGQVLFSEEVIYYTTLSQLNITNKQ